MKLMAFRKTCTLKPHFLGSNLQEYFLNVNRSFINRNNKFKGIEQSDPVTVT